MRPAAPAPALLQPKQAKLRAVKAKTRRPVRLPEGTTIDIEKAEYRLRGEGIVLPEHERPDRTGYRRWRGSGFELLEVLDDQHRRTMPPPVEAVDHLQIARLAIDVEQVHVAVPAMLLEHIVQRRAPDRDRPDRVGFQPGGARGVKGVLRAVAKLVVGQLALPFGDAEG